MTDLPSALAPSSLREGAVVSFDDDTLVVTGGTIVDAIEKRLRAERTARPPRPAPSGTLLEGVPVLNRGESWIVPISFVPFAAADRSIAGESLRERAGELAQRLECVLVRPWRAHRRRSRGVGPGVRRRAQAHRRPRGVVVG